MTFSNMYTASVMLFILVCFMQNKSTRPQRTILDEKFGKFYRPLRLIGLNFVGRSSENKENVKFLQSVGKTQRKIDQSLEFFCDGKNGPGKRSDLPPTSVHRLRPGDIDIIGALGDSLTAGSGIYSTNILHISVENRGMSWAIGGKEDWRHYLTLPNILKEFNPKLYGYSLQDGLASDRSSKFNIAEPGAMSRDIPFEAKVFVTRLKADPMVNVTHHWKLLTILIGSNDFCSDMCFYTNPKKVLEWHEQNMLKALRYLRDNVPRLIVNVVPSPNLRIITNILGLPSQCQTSLRFECPCLIGKAKKTLDFYENIMMKWIKLDSKIVNNEEFNTESFTVNYQPFTQFKELPKRSNGLTDFRYLAADCFHLSQRGHAVAANSLWNNMLEPNGQKTSNWVDAFVKFKCPTVENPYISTRSNNFSIIS